MMMDFKNKLANIHKSVVIWFNSITGLVIISLPMAQDSFPQLQDYVPANWYHYIMGGLVAGNIMLRFKTNSGLEKK